MGKERSGGAFSDGRGFPLDGKPDEAVVLSHDARD